MVVKKVLCLLSLIFLLASTGFAADITWLEKTPMPVIVSSFGYAVVDGNIVASQQVRVSGLESRRFP